MRHRPGRVGQGLARGRSTVLDAAVRRIRPRRTIAVGFSIGSAFAASLRGVRSQGLILVTPFDSLKAVLRAIIRGCRSACSFVRR
jgi:hypothetical protein